MGHRHHVPNASELTPSSHRSFTCLWHHRNVTTHDFSDTSALAPISEDRPLPPSPESDLPDDRFLDRELSWLAFNQRVLELSQDPELPLLERTKFLAIFASNLDEFFMVRVAGLKRRIATGIAVRAASGFTPREVLEAIWARAYELQLRQADIFRVDVRPDLEEAGINLLRWEELTPAEKTEMDRFFDNKVFPIPTLPGANRKLRMAKVRGHLRTRSEGLERGFTKPNNKKHRGYVGPMVNVCAGIINCRVRLWEYLPKTWNGEVAASLYRGHIATALKKWRGPSTSTT